MKNLFWRAVGKFAAGVVLLGLLIVLPAGTLRFPNGWLLMGLLFLPMFCAGLVMLRRSPELLEKRLNAKEEEREQKEVILASGIMFLAAFVTACVLFCLAYALYAEVLRENVWLARTIETQEGQKVVDTGLYGLVRHPMYSATLILFLSMPLILGSIFAFLIMLCYVPIIVKRIRNEAKVLEKGLEGYRAYEKKVSWRLIPYIW